MHDYWKIFQSCLDFVPGLNSEAVPPERAPGAPPGQAILRLTLEHTMSMQTDDYWSQQGRYGGKQPDDFSSERDRQKYEEGQRMRENDRFVEEQTRYWGTDPSKR